MHLKIPINIGSRAVPACLPLSNMGGNFLVGKLMTTSGWGSLQDSQDGPFPTNLRFVKVPGISNELCNEMYSKGNRSISPDEVCAGEILEGGIDSCYGDSGGKLILRLYFINMSHFTASYLIN